MLVYEPVDDVRSPKSLWAPRPMQLKRPDRAGADLFEIADLLAAHAGLTCAPSEDRALLAGRFERLHQKGPRPRFAFCSPFDD